MANNFNDFLRIREAYAEQIPQWMAEYEKTGDMRQDPYFMDWQFTPIESSVWIDIRTAGIPFFPQLPALNYFLDFGNPFLKIGIECDGKAWHDHDMDKARDKRLAAAGWMIFRIEGHECKRTIEPWGDDEEYQSRKATEWFMSTSEGVVTAIKHRYFDGTDDFKQRYAHQIESTLFEHRSTPDNYAVAKKVKPSAGPQLASDVIQEIIEDIYRRANRRKKA